MAQKKDHLYPVVRTGRLTRLSPTPPFAPGIQINAMDFLSKTNRRLYRQARVPSIKIDLDHDSTQTLQVFALSDNWMNHRAMKMAYQMYLENSFEERERLKENQIGRWSDFRVVTGVTTTSAEEVVPTQFDIFGTETKYELGEFQDTAVVDSTGTNRIFTWLGTGTTTRYSILEEYDKAGNAQSTPDTSTGEMPYDDLMADDSAQMAEFLQTKGNLPPYDADGVGAASPWALVATIGAGASQKLSTGFFDAPCGFVIIRVKGSLTTVVDADNLQWTLKSGDYKGVHAPSMLDGVHSSGTQGTWKGNVWTKN